MKNKIKSHLVELRKMKKNKLFTIDEISKGKWIFTIKKEVKDGVVEMDFYDLSELGFEVNQAEREYQLYDVEKRAGIIKEDKNGCDSKNK
jgi:hypothetical protein